MNSFRDMSKAEFDKACREHGFEPHGVMGYYGVGHGTSVSIMNAGNRRSQLAYLLRERDRATEKARIERIKTAGPELLEACKMALLNLEQICVCQVENSHTIQTLRAAITKATTISTPSPAREGEVRK